MVRREQTGKGTMSITGNEKIGVHETATGFGLAGVCGLSLGVQTPSDAVPIWFAALIGAHCKALVNGHPHAVCWNRVSGRAQYTNFGPDMELIEPLGIRLYGGHTLAVSWAPGQTTYTMEVFRALDYLV
jgi:hypothetical protein